MSALYHSLRRNVSKMVNWNDPSILYEDYRAFLGYRNDLMSS